MTLAVHFLLNQIDNHLDPRGEHKDECHFKYQENQFMMRLKNYIGKLGRLV